MEILLSKQCVFVDGKKNGAIYDLKNNKIFQLNNAGKKSIIKFYKKEELTEKEKCFISDLINKEIIDESEKIVQIKKTYFKRPKNEIKFAWLELTDKCNLKCIHCYGNFGYCENKLNYLNLEEWKKVIDQLSNIGCKRVQLIGGEPLCNNNICPIIDYLYTKGIESITIFTNATLILNNKNIKEQIKKYNINVKFSLYGPNEEIHERITKVKGSFNNTISSIDYLKKENINVGVAIIIMKENEKYLEQTKEFVESKLHLKYSGYDIIRPSYINDNIEHRITDSRLLTKRYYTEPRFNISKYKFIMNHFYNACWNSKIAITADGDILPCIFARNFVIGNVRKNNIEELMDKVNKIDSITKNEINECKDCEFRYACSDCRPIAIGINGSKYSKYPRCCYNPKEGIWDKVENISNEFIK